MYWYALCHVGAEQALAQELKKLGITAEQEVGGCSFNATKEEAAQALYYLQCATRLLAAVDKGLYNELELASAHELIPEDATFKVAVEIEAGGPGDTTSMELAGEYGAQISREVDLEEPDYTLFVQVASQSLAGIDVFGDLSKRYYRIFTNARSVKGTLAASILELFEPTGGLLDPFGNTGELAIEAALKATHTSPLKYEKHQPAALLEEHKGSWEDQPREPAFSIWCYDPQLGNLRSCKKNAKLAGVASSIQFSKTDPEWMDVKFKENDLSMIATIPPAVTRRNPSDKHLEELCYQAEYVLRNSEGRLVVCCLNADTAHALAKHAKTYKLRLLKEHIIYSGKLAHHIVCYGL